MFRVLTATFVLLLTGASTARADQTIVLFRHGEKPSSGLGQLTCQGLNRALQLPGVLLPRFGRPDYLYAPDPTEKINDSAGSFYYVRPLATIEPTAIRAGRSVNTHYGYSEIGSLERLLITPKKASTTVFVAWEHLYLVKLLQSIMRHYGNGASVPSWPSGDYDTLYVLHVTYGSTIRAQLQRSSEGLDNLPTACPS